MQIISSYGVELRKQNIPIRQTLEIYRSAVSYLIGIYVQVWEELAEIPDAKRRFNAAEHLVHTTKKNHACLILISGSQRCLPICVDLPSSMLWGQYPLIKHGWIYGKRQTERAGNQGLYMKTTPCRSSTVMSCTVRERKGKTKHT
mgnify:FL=1